METTILDIKRLKNSTMGNPNFKITITGGESYRTPTNAGWAYAIYTGMIGKQATITIKGKTITSLDVESDK